MSLVREISLFLHRIAESAFDDTPRLVFADWLQELGDPKAGDWAELIRLQCRLAQMPEETHDDLLPTLQVDALIRRCGAWVFQQMPLPEGISFLQSGTFTTTFDRGFPAWIAAERWGNIRSHVDMLMKCYPITSLQLGRDSGERYPVAGSWSVDYEELAGASWGQRIAGLEFRGQVVTWTNLTDLVESPHWQGLRTLSLPDSVVHLERMWEAVEQWPHLSRIELPGMAFRHLADDAMVPRLPLVRLRHLGLERTRLTMAQFDQFVTSGSFPSLIDLRLTGNLLASTDVVALAQSTTFSHLRDLALNHNLLDNQAAEALAHSPAVNRLRRLDLGYNRIDGEGIEALADSRHLDNLHELYLDELSVGDSVLSLLRLPNLKVISMTNLDRLSQRAQRRLRNALGEGLWTREVSFLN